MSEERGGCFFLRVSDGGWTSDLTVFPERRSLSLASHLVHAGQLVGKPFSGPTRNAGLREDDWLHRFSEESVNKTLQALKYVGAKIDKRDG